MPSAWDGFGLPFNVLETVALTPYSARVRLLAAPSQDSPTPSTQIICPANTYGAHLYSTDGSFRYALGSAAHPGPPPPLPLATAGTLNFNAFALGTTVMANQDSTVVFPDPTIETTIWIHSMVSYLEVIVTLLR